MHVTPRVRHEPRGRQTMEGLTRIPKLHCGSASAPVTIAVNDIARGSHRHQDVQASKANQHCFCDPQGMCDAVEDFLIA